MLSYWPHSYFNDLIFNCKTIKLISKCVELNILKNLYKYVICCIIVIDCTAYSYNSWIIVYRINFNISRIIKLNSFPSFSFCLITINNLLTALRIALDAKWQIDMKFMSLGTVQLKLISVLLCTCGRSRKKSLVVLI